MKKSLSILAAMAALSFNARADRFTTASQDMNDGSAGSFWDLGSDSSGQEFFGFGDSLTPPYWGALISIPVGTGTNPNIFINSIEILFDPGQFDGTNDPLDNNGNPLTSAPDGLLETTGCTPIGIQASGSPVTPTSISSPEFVGGETTYVTCQFTNPNFPPTTSSAYYVVTQLQSITTTQSSQSVNSSITPAVVVPGGGNVGLTFLTNSVVTTPEPAAIGLCVLGLAAMAGLRRRRVR